MLITWGTMNAVNQTPSYLYKILSYRNWQATIGRKVVILDSADKEFIHFSTAEQLDGIVQKYWATAPQFVVLKIDVSRVQGQLKYEANPGGSNQYYHLYNGYIPIQAIAEAKITFKESLPSAHQNRLDLVHSGDPVLRKKARALTHAEILSPEIQDLIQDMKAAMRAAPGVGLAAPQIGKPIQLAVIEDMEHSFLTPEQLAELDRRQVPFHVVINPTLIVEESDTASFFEGCLSIPGYLGIVPRAKAVRVECLNEKGEPVIIRAKGWHARILQHEIDHLNGTLYLDKVFKETVMTQENYDRLWKGKSIKEICEELRGPETR